MDKSPKCLVILVDEGPNKLSCCKAIKFTLDIGLKEAKEIMPYFGGSGTLAKNVTKKRALEIKAAIEEHGAIVKIEKEKGNGNGKAL
jgi:ribosomal protein L7/L12